MILATFNQGQFFGELPLMLGVPYPTTMRSLCETIVFVIDGQNFAKLLHQYPELAEEIVQELATRRQL